MINVFNYVDASILSAIFKAQDEEFQINRPWLTGILPQKTQPNYTMKLATMVKQVRNIMPHVARGNEPIEIGKEKMKTQIAEMAHFFVKQSITESDVFYLQESISRILNGNLPTDEAYKIVNEFHAGLRMKSLKMYSDAITFMISQLLTNPQGVKITADIHSDPFTHLQDGINSYINRFRY